MKNETTILRCYSGCTRTLYLVREGMVFVALPEEERVCSRYNNSPGLHEILFFLNHAHRRSLFFNMFFFNTIFATFAAVSLAVPSAHRSDALAPDPYEAIHQRESILAETLDTKNWDRLGESMTEDIVYDSRPLGPNYGGLSQGLAEVIKNTKKGFGKSKVAHHVSNAIIRLNKDGTKANVTT